MKAGLLTLLAALAGLGTACSARAEEYQIDDGTVLLTSETAVLCHSPENLLETRHYEANSEGLRRLFCLYVRPGLKAKVTMTDVINTAKLTPIQVSIPMPKGKPAILWGYPFAFTYADGTPLPFVHRR